MEKEGEQATDEWVAPAAPRKWPIYRPELEMMGLIPSQPRTPPPPSTAHLDVRIVRGMEGIGATPVQSPRLLLTPDAPRKATVRENTCMLSAIRKLNL